MSLGRNLYRLARITRDIEAVESRNPRRMRRRAKNVVVGRALSRAGFWRWLYR
jgi:hypothetical protein